MKKILEPPLNLKKAAEWSKRFEKEVISIEVVMEDTIVDAIKILPTGKAGVSNDIIVSIMKKTIDAYCPKLTQAINDCLRNNVFHWYTKKCWNNSVFQKRRQTRKREL